MKRITQITLATFAAGALFVGCKDQPSKTESLTQLPGPATTTAVPDAPLDDEDSPITPTPTPKIETKRPDVPAVAQTDVQRNRTEKLRERFVDAEQKWKVLEVRKDPKTAPQKAQEVERALESARADLQSLQRADGTHWPELEVKFEAELDVLEKKIDAANAKMDG